MCAQRAPLRVVALGRGAGRFRGGSETRAAEQHFGAFRTVLNSRVSPATRLRNRQAPRERWHCGDRCLWTCSQRFTASASFPQISITTGTRTVSSPPRRAARGSGAGPERGRNRACAHPRCCSNQASSARIFSSSAFSRRRRSAVWCCARSSSSRRLSSSICSVKWPGAPGLALTWGGAD